MKNWILLLLLCSIASCEKEPEDPAEPAPTDITLSGAAIYTNLEPGFVAGELTADIFIGVTFELVSGAGDTDNGNFTIEGSLLKSKVKFDNTNGPTQSVRVQANNKGSTFEKEFTIEIKQYDGPNPIITSSSFKDGEAFPRDFGADNGNVSPDLKFENIPPNTNSLAITMIDLDFNLSVHWTVWNIPNTITEIDKNQKWGAGITKGESQYGPGYTGPFPPAGETHRYEITVYFLDSKIALSPNKYSKLPGAVAGKTIAVGKIIGTYTP